MISCTEQVEEQCSNGSYSSDNPLRVTILGSELGVSRLDSITFSQELAIQLAKIPYVKVTFLVPENSYISTCSSFKRQAAIIGSVTIVEAQEKPGFDDPIEWLYFPPQDLKTDIVVGAGERFGKISQVFKEFQQCKSIYIASYPLGKHAILVENRTMLEKLMASHDEFRNSVELSQMADFAVALGQEMHDKLSVSLCYHKKDVFKFIPGVLSKFCDVAHATDERTNFRILMLGGGDPDNFEQEGLNTAAEAMAELKDKSYHLFYVGAAKGRHRQFAKKFCQLGVSKSQLTIRSFPKSEEELKRLFCEVDLVIMPSSEQGFGMVTLAALSSGLPVLVHEDSGFGVALKEVTFGAFSTVESEDANVWAQAIKGLRKKDRKIRLQEAALVHSNYDKKYSWEEQCGALVQAMLTMVSEPSVKRRTDLQPPCTSPKLHKLMPGILTALEKPVSHEAYSTSQCRASAETAAKQITNESPLPPDLPGQMFRDLQEMQCDISKISSNTDLLVELEKIASVKGFVISDNDGLGNCMFHALSEQLNLVKGIKISHGQLRQAVVQYLRNNPKLRDGTELFTFIDGYRSWTDYLCDMERDGTWGDHVILYATANCYETYILVISSQSNLRDVTIRPDSHVISTNPLVLGHIHEVHYVSLQPKKVSVAVVEEGARENDHDNGNQECSFKVGEPNDPALNELAGKIAAKWQTLGLYLGIGQDTLDVIDANERDKPYRMLLRWKNTTPSTTLYQDLYNALCHVRVGLNKVAKEFCCKKTT